MQMPEWAQRAWEPVAPYAEKMAVWRGYEAELQTLLIWVIGIVLYTGIVFAFYQQMAKVDAWHSKPKPGYWGKFVRFCESTLVFPVMSFLFFGVLAAALFMLAKSQTVGGIFLVAMSIVVGVRVMAYVSEGASADLSRLLPLGLLGVFLVDPSNMAWADVWARVKDVPSQVDVLARYFLLFLVLETTLSLGRRSVKRIREKATLARASRPLKRKQLVDAVTHDAEGMPVRTLPVKGPPQVPPHPLHKAKEGPAAAETHFQEVE